MRVLFAFLLVLVLAGCGFQPLHGDVSDDQVEAASYLAATKVKVRGGEMAQRLQNELEDRLNPTSATSLYGRDYFRLEAQVNDTRDPLLVEQDGNILRYNIELVSRFRLIRTKDNEVLHSGVVRRIASFNVVDEKFAAYVAEKDAVQRALAEMSEDYKMRLVAYFSQHYK